MARRRQTRRVGDGQPPAEASAAASGAGADAAAAAEPPSAAKRRRAEDAEAVPPAGPEDAAKTRQEGAVRSALARGDWEALEDIAYNSGGFLSEELRRAAWLFLLGLSAEEAAQDSWRPELGGVQEESQEAKVMQADVQRSVYSWDVHTGINQQTRDEKRINLSEVMHAVLRKHSGHLGYFQGFHDIVLVFLEVGSTSQAFHMAERMALFHLTDQLCCPFDQGLLPLLGVMLQLLTLVDRTLALALEEAGCGEMHFAVPWVLTWFAHSLPRLHSQVMRLFDCLICSHPAAILYFSAALLVEHRDAVLQAPRDMPEMVCTIQSLPLREVDVDKWAASARRLMLRFPPTAFLESLPLEKWRALPRTSPLLHFPHPWMPSRDGVAATDARGDALAQLSPVYSGAPPRAREPRPPGLFGGVLWKAGARGGAVGGVLTGVFLRTLGFASADRSGVSSAAVILLRIVGGVAIAATARAILRH